MTHNSTNSCRIARRADYQGAWVASTSQGAQKWTHKLPNNFFSQINTSTENEKTVPIIAELYKCSIWPSNRWTNNKKRNNTKPYNWYTQQFDKEIQDTLVTEVRNKFEILQNVENSNSASTQYSHFEKACRELADKTIPLKQKRSKHLPWESTDIYEKREKLCAATEKWI